MVQLNHEGFGYLPPSITSITVENCQSTTVFPNSLKNLKSLLRVSLKNIGTVKLEENAFRWGTTEVLESYPNPGIDIEIVNTTLEAVPSQAFSGHVNSVILEGVAVGELQALAFSSLAGTERISFRSCHIGAIVPQAMKKFRLGSLLVIGGMIGRMDSYAIKDVTINEEIRVEGADLGIVRSLAVVVSGPSAVRLKGCRVTLTEGHAWSIISRGPVFLEDNIFGDLNSGAFFGLSLDPRLPSSPQEIVFENNTIRQFQHWALAFNTSGLRPSFDRLLIEQQCSCDEISVWTMKLVKYSSPKIIYPNITKSVWCLDSKRDVIISEFIHRKCDFDRDTLYWVVGVALTVLILVASCFICIFAFRKWKELYTEVKTNRELINQNRLSTYSTNSYNIVHPPAKTYVETDIDEDIFQEQAEPLKNSQNDISNYKITGF